MFKLLLLTVPILSAHNWQQPDLGSPCKKGEKGTPGIKYYLDDSVNMVFPFKDIHGCGEPGNRYDDRNSSPKFGDFQACSGYPEGKGGCSGPDAERNFHCPAGYYCEVVWTGNGGFCCDQAAADRDAENRKAPECIAKKLETVTYSDENYGDVTLLGRNCSHQFCPTDSTCHQGEFYAYCCKTNKR